MALEGALAVGTYSVLVFLTQRLLWPLTRLGQTFDLYQRAMASTRRVLDLLHTPVNDRLGASEARAAAGPRRAALRGRDFAYDAREPILEGFELEIPAGATVGIVGATGSGKTTLINLLLRFYEPQRGRITLDGRTSPMPRHRGSARAIGLVSQSVLPVSRLGARQHRLWQLRRHREQVTEAARMAEAADFIEALPDGAIPSSGERGQTLSGGQRQRISIRAGAAQGPADLDPR